MEKGSTKALGKNNARFVKIRQTKNKLYYIARYQDICKHIMYRDNQDNKNVFFRYVKQL